MRVKQMVWLAVVVAVLLVPMGPGHAQDQVTVTLDTITLSPGESGSINAVIDCPLEGGCSGFAVEIRFDPAVVGVDDALVGPYLGDESFRAEKLIDNETGVVRLAAVALGAQPEYGEPVLLTLDLTARTAGVAPLTVFELQIADVAGNPADARGIAGAVVVMQAPAAPPTPSPTLIPVEVPETSSAVRLTFDLPADPATSGALAGVDPSGQTVIFWHVMSGTRGDELAAMIADFNAQNPWGITVNGTYTGGYGDTHGATVAALAAGDVPNLVLAYQEQAAEYYVADGLVENMDRYVLDPTWGFNATENASFKPGIFSQDYLPGTDTRTGFPFYRSMEVLYYNKDRLDELGFDGPPQNWQEFEEIVCAFVEAFDKDHGILFSSDASRFASGVFSLGGDIYTGSAYDFDSPAALDLVTLQARLIDWRCAGLNTEAFGDEAAFAEANTIFYIGSTSGIPFVQAGIDESRAFYSWGVAPLPYTERPVQNVYGASVSLLRTTPEEELAGWLFLRWLTDPAQQLRWADASGYYPVNLTTDLSRAAQAAAHTAYVMGWDVMHISTIKTEPGTPGYSEIRNLVSAYYEEILASGDPPRDWVEAMLQELTAAANEIIGAP